MSTGRVLWIIFCLMWVGWWGTFGFAIFPFNLLLIIGSVAAILIPIGKGDSVKSLRHDTSYRPSIPSSPYDPRFTEEELSNYWHNRDK